MDGILPIWKEKGMTSFDCVFQVRRLLRTKKVGHSGTLDPEVDGVLPICVGKATKVVEYLLESNKVYTGEITLGVATETEDAYGAVIEQVAVLQPLTTTEIDEKMQLLRGTIQQIPPMYSAVKVNGKRLYEYARKGKVVERPIREVEIFSFERTSEPVYDAVRQTQSWSFKVSCSKGTYVRTLAVDLGRALGFPAHMSQLTRIKSGSFTQQNCVTLEELQAACEANTVSAAFKPMDWALQQYPQVDIDEALFARVKNGALITQAEWPQVQGLTRIYFQEKLIALYDLHPQKVGVLKPVKMF